MSTESMKKAQCSLFTNWTVPEQPHTFDIWQSQVTPKSCPQSKTFVPSSRPLLLLQQPVRRQNSLDISTERATGARKWSYGGHIQTLDAWIKISGSAYQNMPGLVLILGQVKVLPHQNICCSLRSRLHEIPTMIRTIPHGLEDNHACKWLSDNFPGILTYVLFLENCLNPFACKVVCQSTWKGPFSSYKYGTDLSPRLIVLRTCPHGLENNHACK